MGKRPEDLQINDAPHKLPTGPDDRESEWYQFCQEIDDMLASMDFDWASETLNGIRTSVEKFRTVTEGQKRAVANVRAARSRADGFRRRRYEGWGGRGRY